MYNLKFLSNAEFDMLPYKHAKEAFGCADTRTKTAYVRRTGVKPLDQFVAGHEMAELVDKYSEHEVDGIRYKGGWVGENLFTADPFGLQKKLGQNIEKTFFPEKLNTTIKETPVLGDMASRGWMGNVVQNATKEGREYGMTDKGLKSEELQMQTIPLMVALTKGLGMAGSFGSKAGAGATGASTGAGATGTAAGTAGGSGMNFGLLANNPYAVSGASGVSSAGGLASGIGGGTLASTGASTGMGAGAGTAANASWVDKIWGAGKGVMNNQLGRTAVGAAVPLIGGAFQKQPTQFQATDSALYNDVVNRIQQGTTVPLSDAQRQAITANYDQQLKTAKENILSKWKAVRPGSDITNDSELAQALNDLETDYAEQKANAVTLAQMNLTSEQTNQLMQLASLDVYSLAQRAQISLEEAQAFKQMLSQIGVMVAGSGQNKVYSGGGQ